MGIRCKAAHGMLVEEAELPAELMPLFEEAEKAVLGLGFQYSHCQMAAPHVVDQKPQFFKVYVHPHSSTHAVISRSQVPETGAAFSVEFTTFLADGREINTVDHILHLMEPMPPRYQYHDHYVLDPLKQWEAHERTVKPLAGMQEILRFSPQGFVERANRFYQEMTAYRIDTGWIVPTGDGETYRYSPLKGLKFAWQILSGSRKAAAAAKAHSSRTPTAADSSEVAANIAAFEQFQDMEQKQRGGWAPKLAMLVVSGLLFYLAFGMVFSWELVPIVLGVLILHELGHFLGMKLFKYQNPHILFVPLLGAVTMGQKEDATPIQKVLIYLLGPLPGILLGFALLGVCASTGHKLAFEIGLMALVINYLNLLPITPFDGGRIIETLLFSRFPRVQLAFAVASVLALALGSYHFKDPVLIACTVLVLCGLPARWRQGVAAGRVAGLVKPGADRRDGLHAIFQVLTQPPFHRQIFAARFHLAKYLLEQLSSGLAAPKLKTVVAGTALYGLVLLSPLIVVLALAPQGRGSAGLLSHFINSAATESQREPDWADALRKDPSDSERWQVLVNAADWNMDAEQYEEAKTYLQQALEIANGFAPTDMRIVDTRLKLADADYDEKATDQAYREVLEYVERVHGPDHPRVAEIIERTTWVGDFEENVKEKLQQLQRTLRIRDNLDLCHQQECALTLTSLAHLYELDGRRESAEEAYHRAVSVEDELRNNDPRRRFPFRAVGLLADFYVRCGQASAAERLLTERITQWQGMKEDLHYTALANLERKLGWIYMGQQRYPEAGKSFEAAMQYFGRSMGGKMRGSSIIALPYQVDLCCADLQAGHTDASIKRFNSMKKEMETDGVMSMDHYLAELKEQTKGLTQAMTIVPLERSPATQIARRDTVETLMGMAR
jgi:Zn-dependent protease/tetratricopeptide (TPR) repeat protein